MVLGDDIRYVSIVCVVVFVDFFLGGSQSLNL